MCSIKELSAKQIFDLFVSKCHKKFKGNIAMQTMNSLITIKDKSLVGYALQEWFGEWLKSEKIYFRVNKNTQMSPDFYLSESKTSGLLELKTFDAKASANFDIANFESYCKSLETDAYKLDEDFLIISYTMEEGILKIKDSWLKKIWEITCGSKKYPIRTQNKKGMIYNIRPAVWDSNKAKFKPFETKQDFLKALSDTLLKYEKTKPESNNWLKKVSENYKECTKKDLF